ncbi:restriction endonuclease subunit S [Aliidiomarina sanyensis]|uniref:Restriction endonuclease subunit S n=1 Tax=Aliidiomarina sanyensis TaxID=1249555 RepID=A0A432WBI4_9GAMM|nr:restriction endonuclease subunit S [Aliidiomarina sanyensis]RUO28753.1 restriction endonuclease subunit S [Aliidiomarina sanyensis]
MTNKLISNTVPLGSIADVRMGFTFRERVDEVKNGNAHIVQLKDTRKVWDETQSVAITPSDLPQINWQGKPKAFVEADSIILPSKGSFLKAFKIAPSQNGLPVVVSSQFLVITVKESHKNKVSADFLCWILNEASTQRLLVGESQGTNIMLLKTSAVKQVHIPLPTLKKQNQILTLDTMWKREQQLTHALLANREAMITGVLQQLLKETN